MTSALAILDTLRARGARVRIAGERIGIEPRSVLDADLADAVRAHRGELRRLLAAERTAAEWRTRFELLAAERSHVQGYDRAAARSWAYVELLVEWTEAHPDVNVLPSALAEPVARFALGELGICAPTRSENAEGDA